MRPLVVGAVLTVIVAALVVQAVAGPAGYFPISGGVIPHGPGGPPSAGGSLAPITVWQSAGIDFGIEGRSYVVVQTDAEWQALWQAFSLGPEPAPEVDLDAVTVIAAFFGVANTGGHSIAIGDVVLGEDGTVHVLATTESPGANCAVIQVLTYPVHMVSTPKSYGPFAVEETATTHPCP